MEGSESEAIFDSLKLNPQLFVNEVLNRLDDSLDGAFDFFHQEASTVFKIEEGTDRANDLAKGVAYLRDMIRSTLDRPLELWEKYCLRHVFAVPEGFSLPTTNESSCDIPMNIDAVDDTELDAQLAFLRDKLILVGKESTELKREYQSLESQSLLSNNRAGSLNKVLQLHEEYFDREMFEELKRTAQELRAKLEKLNIRRVEETECITLERMSISNGDMFRMNLPNGLSKATLEELQQFLTDIKGA